MKLLESYTDVENNVNIKNIVILRYKNLKMLQYTKQCKYVHLNDYDLPDPLAVRGSHFFFPACPVPS